MSVHPAGLQGRSQYLSSSLGKLKGELDQTVASIASGKVADIGNALKGGTQQLSIIEADIVFLTQQKQNISEALAMSQYAYQVVENIGELVASASASLREATLSEMPLPISVQANDIEQKFKSVLGSLNASFAGAYIFSGHNSLSPTIADPEMILAEIENVARGARDADQVIAAVDSWFDAPDGFSRLVNIKRFTVAATEYGVDGAFSGNELISVAGDLSFLGNALKGLAIASLASRGVPNEVPEQQRALLIRSGEYFNSGAMDLIYEGALVGGAVSNLESRATQVSSTIAALQQVNSEIRSADLKSASIKISEIEVRVDIIYNLIARISRLSLSGYLR